MSRKHYSLNGCPYRKLAARIEELGGLYALVGGEQQKYVSVYYALNKYKNPRKSTIDFILSATGMTYEEAFSVERESDADF